jgi:hypothetical protein
VIRFRALLGCFLLGVLGFVSIAEAQDSYYYTYFKRVVPLTESHDRIAVLDSSSSPDDLRQLFDDAEYRSAKRLPSPLHGWSLYSIPAESSGPEAASARISSLVQADTDHRYFFSPVFAGKLPGSAVVVLPEILVQFEQNVSTSRIAELLARNGAHDMRVTGLGRLPRAYRLVDGNARSASDVLRVANKLAQFKEVRFAEPNVAFTGRSALIPNDPGFPASWALHNTGQLGGTPEMDLDAPEAWDISLGSPSIITVILDTGVQQNHPDLNQITGTDVTDDPASPDDGRPVNACDKHGTPVAGVISAVINNSLGAVGAAPHTKIASVRTFISTTPDCSLGWSTQTIWTVNALAWAESIGARVTNNSNNYGFESAAIDAKYQQTKDAGMVHFASAGNDGAGVIWYPAKIASVNAVTGVDRNGNQTAFSNWGPQADFTAPALDIYTTDMTGAAGWVSGDYLTNAWGTSFSSPFAAAVAALILSISPGLSALEVEAHMRLTAIDRGDPGWDQLYGWGMVNLGNAASSPTKNAMTVAQSVPSTMAAGRVYPVSITLKNTGGESWDPIGPQCGAFRLGSANPYNNATWVPVQRVELPTQVASGGQVTLSFNVTAPTIPGTYNFQWQMVQECVGWFGGFTPNVPVTVQAAPAKDAQILSQSVPSTMAAGRVYPVSITLKNVGTQTWSPIGPQCNAFRLGSANPHNNATWVPVTRVELPAQVAPGGQVTLNFTVAAPMTPGTYNFQWQMVQECVGWFGDLTPNVPVTVQAAPAKDAQILSQSIPSTMTAGQSYPVSIKLKNVGTQAWSPIGIQCNGFRLGSANPYNNATWVPLTRVELPASVAAGGQVTLNFTVSAPATPGTYNFQWRMIQECVTWFGDLSPNVAVAVNP